MPVLHSQGSGICVEEGTERGQKPEVVYDFKETALSRHSRVDAHINSETVITYTKPAQVQARQNSNMEQGM